MSEAPLTVTLTREGGRDWVQHPDAELRLTAPGGAEHRLQLGLRPVLIGSGPDCVLRLDGAGLSRRHCEVQLTPKGVRLVDLDSKNGTRILGVAITSALLPPGVGAQLGHAQLQVVPKRSVVSVPLSSQPRFGEALGLSVPMRALFAVLERVAPMSEPVLLTGESGTGKELLVRALHQHSRRAKGPLVVVDCGAIAPQLIESELFGHLRGAFSGATAERSGLLAEADGGTLFLDEIGELPLEMQPRLLRALESGEVRKVGESQYRRIDVRVVAATHRDLRAEVAAGRFREDLLYRLAVIEAHVPALRERKQDLPLLVEAFLQARSPPVPLSEVPAQTLALFQAYDWPGNVRELRNAVARLAVTPHAPLPPARGGASPEARAGQALVHLPLKEARALVVADFERAYLAAQLEAHGSAPAAARAMGVSRQLVHRMQHEYGLAERDDG
ncbi:MAG: sigma 54-interacting transcriptional regulator [Archangiaceae bacterium]|nr:sigma 54-interacting transcriptional regulator [Archangiaceae bacterium]